MEYGSKKVATLKVGYETFRDNKKIFRRKITKHQGFLNKILVKGRRVREQN